MKGPDVDASRVNLSVSVETPEQMLHVVTALMNVLTGFALDGMSVSLYASPEVDFDEEEIDYNEVAYSEHEEETDPAPKGEPEDD